MIFSFHLGEDVAIFIYIVNRFKLALFETCYNFENILEGLKSRATIMPRNSLRDQNDWLV